MKVNGDVSPNTIHIEKSAIIPGYVEVRLRDNISQVELIDEISGRNMQKYDYDEYTFELPYREGLREEIEAKFDDWIASGRALEQNTQASAYVDLQTALAAAPTVEEINAAMQEGVNSI